MSQVDTPAFEILFERLAGHAPFPWQHALFERLFRGDFPAVRVCDIPTGLGKTSIIALWLLALALRPRDAERFPRRLVYIVNRRTVVDQATREVERLVVALRSPGLEDVARRLRELWAFEAPDPIAVSTLRGELADNGEWRRDPARPAIVVGTVDMIGSRLLFSGYGRCGFKHRPLHAALVGQDSLIVHDEAHLEPAFQALLDTVHREQRRGGDPFPIHVVELTATARSISGAFTLSDADLENARVRKRLNASKGLSIITVADNKKVVDAIVQRALLRKESGRTVLVFARTVEDVNRIAGALEKSTSSERVDRLTGTQRGHERRHLLENPVFKRFLADSAEAGPTVYLVCTSAGEVGIDMSADDLVCDLTTFDSLAQRLGRVNRFGLAESIIDVVCEQVDEGSDKIDEWQRRRALTLALIRRLPVREAGVFDGSPAALRTLPPEDRTAAFAPAPPVLAATDILFDMWSMTSVRGRLAGRPPVADWLHGVPADWMAAETEVAWRHEVDWLTPPGTIDPHPADLEDLLDDYPLKSHELLRERSDRVFAALQEIANRHPDHYAWFIRSDESFEVLTLRALIESDSRGKPVRRLADATVILGPSCGGLSKGYLDGSCDEAATEVADEWRDERDRQRRVRTELPADAVLAGMRLVREMEVADAKADEDGREEGSLRYWFVRPRSADDDGSRFALFRQTLEAHNSTAEELMARLTGALHIETTLAKALTYAAARHDDGKGRELWQRAIGNSNYPGEVLAKSDSRKGTLLTTGYRHELGSLTALAREAAESGHGADDVVSQAIGAHHGRCRPHFAGDEAFDPECELGVTDAVVREAPRRFARLQRRYGRWGLAYLESLLRAVDAKASEPPAGPPTGEGD